MMPLAIRLPAALALAYIIATMGAWIHYPHYITKPELAVEIWRQMGLAMPYYFKISTGIGVAFALLIIGLPKRKQEKYGKAKWGDYTTVKALNLRGKDGIYFGKWKTRFRSIPLFLEQSLSTLILAPPGTGKTTAIAIPTLLKSRNSFLTLDLKGELFEITGPTRSTFSRVVRFDPTSGKSAVFNVFSENNLPRDLLDYNGHILNTAQIIIPAKKDGDDYFTTAARDAFGFFAEWLIFTNGETSIPEIRSKILSEKDIKATIEGMINDAFDMTKTPAIMDHPDADRHIDRLRDSIKRNGNSVLIAAASDEQWAGVMGTLTSALQPFGDARIEQATSGRSDISGEEMKKERVSIYLVIPDKDISRLSPIITLIFETVGSQLISKMPEKGQIPITFMLDEFVRLGKLQRVKELPAISRGYRVNVVFIAQDVQQIIDRYGKEAAGIFASTCAYRVVFRQNELDTAKLLSETIGKATTTRESTNISTKGVFSTKSGGSVSDEGLELVTPQDVMNLSDRNMLILGQGQLMRPLNIKKNSWYEDKELVKLVETNKHLLPILMA